MVSALRFPLLAVLVALAACDDEPCPRGSMLDSADGLVVTLEEHPTGWGLGDCFECHHKATIHRLGCAPEVDFVALRAVVDVGGLESCSSCHGDNGVAEDPDADTGEEEAR